MIMLDGGIDPAQLHLQMRLGQTAIAAGALQRRAGIRKLAKGVNRDTRNGTLMRRGSETLYWFAHRPVRLKRYWPTVEAPADCSTDLSLVCLSAWVTSPFS